MAGSWRALPPQLEVSDHELKKATPWLLQSGAGALAWRRVATSSLAISDAGMELQQAYRLHTLRALKHERYITRVLTLLHREGIEPILVKGWSVARLYPERGLRPYGDIDLCIAPADFARAERVLKNTEGSLSQVDLHCDFQKFDNRSWKSMYQRSVVAELEGVEVRMLCPEDQLQLLSFHFLREGAWRPLWLCDIALLLETRPESFLWPVAIKEGKRSDWLACSLLLAHQLLNANLDGVPSTMVSKRLPRWFVPCVLREWIKPSMPIRHRLPLHKSSLSPIETLNALRARWPNKIEGTVGVGGPFNEVPRLPFQMAHCFLRASKYLSLPI
ncbi:MAG TPA: nucleotidyltransferase family protein [Pyrinomonadaceae bacterium]|nr:nucleotidyltransferase family protein [Pyrinomonadaceae bacterium]